MSKQYVLQHKDTTHSWLQPTNHQLVTVVEGKVVTDNMAVVQELIERCGFSLKEEQEVQEGGLN